LDTAAAPIRVLLIDDEEAFLVTAGEMLRQTGHSVTTAPTVAAALALLARRPLPSVVVLDLVLGEEDPRRLHEALVRRGVPVLLVSGAEPERLASVAEEHGWRWASKPVEPDALLTTLDALAERPELAPAPPPPPARPGVPVSVQLVDRLGDIVGVIALAYLCAAGKLPGELTLVGIGGILGVGTGLRHVGQRALGATATAATGLGVVGLLVLHAGPPVGQLAHLAARARGLAVLCLTVALALGTGA
jgi:CheY-like chemotaxis protein